MEVYAPEEMGWIHHSSHLHALQLIPSDHTHPQTRCCVLTAATGRPEPVYGCRPCNFYIHKTCAELPAYLHHPSHTLTLVPTPPYLEGTVQSDACWKEINGFSYHCTNCSFDLHAHCAFLPPSFNQPCTNVAGQAPNPVSSMPPAIWPVDGQPEPTAYDGQPFNLLSSLTPAVWPGQAGAPAYISSGLDPIHSQGSGWGRYPCQANFFKDMMDLANTVAVESAKTIVDLVSG